jgi:AcrR family transcriptional regulator
MPRSGRRPGTVDTREAILEAARDLFGTAGFTATTIRGIAGAAEVDPALVLHYFGSKEAIFDAAMQLPFEPAAVLPELIAAGSDGLGERLARFFLEVWESPRGSAMLGIVRSVVASPAAAAMFRERLTSEVLARVATAAELDQPQLRAALVASQLVGVAIARYVVRVEPLAAATAEDVAGWIGPTLQRYLTDPTVINHQEVNS